MTEREPILARSPRDTAQPPPSEPATARALWPTFMRRTLSEEVLRHPAEATPAK